MWITMEMDRKWWELITMGVKHFMFYPQWQANYNGDLTRVVDKETGEYLGEIRIRAFSGNVQFISDDYCNYFVDKGVNFVDTPTYDFVNKKFKDQTLHAYLISEFNDERKDSVNKYYCRINHRESGRSFGVRYLETLGHKMELESKHGMGYTSENNLKRLFKKNV